MRIISSDYPLIKSNIHHKVHKVEFKRFTKTNETDSKQAKTFSQQYLKEVLLDG